MSLQAMVQRMFLGIDIGTQGLSVILTDAECDVLAVGEGNYEMVSGLSAGQYEQRPSDWESALIQAMVDLRGKLPGRCNFKSVSAIGISGQMHGEVLADESGLPFAPARLWCDSRNEREGQELTSLLSVKMPKRMTASRWLWTARNRTELAAQTRRITTPAGWIAYRLTGQWTLGIGDASGMFPVDSSTQTFDETRLATFDAFMAGQDLPPIRALLPSVSVAGDDGGVLNSIGAEILNLPEGIPVAPAEGDQPAALAGSAIGAAGWVSVSFGTSVCANLIGDHEFEGVHDAVDHFSSVDGKAIQMVFLRNGTTFMNVVADMFAAQHSRAGAIPFADLMKMAVDSSSDCGGLLAIPLMDDEPGLGIGCGGHAALYGINARNNSAGNAIKAALVATMFNLMGGLEILDRQGFYRSHIVLTGGLTKTPEWGQVLADVTGTTVSVPPAADEGTAMGSVLLAKFRAAKLEGSSEAWEDFLARHSHPARKQFQPMPVASAVYQSQKTKYQEILNRIAKTNEA